MKKEDYIIKVNNLRALGFFEGCVWGLSMVLLLLGVAFLIKGHSKGFSAIIFSGLLMVMYRLVRIFLNEKTEELTNES